MNRESGMRQKEICFIDTGVNIVFFYLFECITKIRVLLIHCSMFSVIKIILVFLFMSFLVISKMVIDFHV
jgi:hypothetical protein